jgi:hypothetical protein
VSALDLFTRPIRPDIELTRRLMLRPQQLCMAYVRRQHWAGVQEVRFSSQAWV